MLDSLQPGRVDPRRSSVGFDAPGVEVRLVHLHRQDRSILVTVGDSDATVATLGAREHFFGSADVEDDGRPWTAQVVDFVAEILRGEIEVETTYRGRAPLSVEHFSIDATGRRRSLGSTGFLTAARFFFWRSKRTETARASWL